MSPRRIKEASVAGESPDRSEQRKSSGTAPEEHDPRLAVFREPVAPARPGNESATGSTAGGARDTATAVFGSRLSSDGPDGPGGPDETEEPKRSVAGSGTGAQGAQDAPEGAGQPVEAAEGADASEEAPTPREGRVPAGGAAVSVGSGDANEAEREAEPVAEKDSGAEPEPAPGADPVPGDARLRAAVAAWVATGDDRGPAAAVRPDADAVAETAGDGGASEGGEPSRAAVTGHSGVDEEDGADGGEAAAEEGETSQGAPAPAADSSSGATRVPRTREEATAREPEAVASERTASPRATSEPAASEDAASGRAQVAKDAEPGRDKGGIDQPTAVFKAFRPAQVDQPTTALKLPPEARPKQVPAPESRSGSGPGTPAERTSRFVPLRSDDIRPSPSVGPTVTPAITPGPGPDARRAGHTGSPGNVGGLTEAERTRQQPLPPRPPLDLLAELTNTPPPPQTPVRTVVRRVKIWTPLLLLVLIIFAVAQAVRPLPAPVLVLSAAPTYTFGGEKLDMPWPAEGQGAVEVEGVGTIGTYGKEKSAPIASMAKVMTAYVILKEHPITGKQTGERIEVDKQAGEEAAITDESTAAIEEGEKYTERQMLEMLMIPSGNNVARLLARWDATTEKAFVEKMNTAAEDLGMTNSTYTDPSGLKSSTMSTPADQLRLARAVMQNDVFREIVNMPQTEIPGVGKIYNNNSILLEPGVSGIKTGSSTPAGGNLVWAADTIIDGKSRRILGVVMGADLEGSLNDKLERARQNSLKLIQVAQKGVDSALVVKKGQVVGYIDDGFGGRTPVVSTKDLKAIGWGGLKVELDLAAGEQELAHAAKSGTVVGAVTVGTGTGKVSAPVALQSEMTEPTFGEKLTRIS